MKTTFLSKLVCIELIGGKYIELYLPFSYYSEFLEMIVEIPAKFICDKESVPVIEATSVHGGVIHDYFCRIDSKPIVTKQIAAKLYLEAQICRDEMLNEGWFKRLNRKFRRQFKTIIVRITPGYFHKHKVLSTLDEISKATNAKQ